MSQSSKRRTLAFGLTAFLALGLVVGVGKSVQAFGGHGGHGPRGAIMRRLASAHVDEALDAAKASKEQRDKVHAVKERLFRTFEDSHRGGGAKLDEALRLFTADTLDRARMTALRKERQAEMERMGDAVEQAVTEVHDVLTPEQRRVVADYVAQHRPGR